MSDHAAHGTHEHAKDSHHHGASHGQAPAAQPMDFDKAELSLFDREDTSAGGNIGKMLAVIFLYTIIAMGIAGWWTYSALTR